MRGAPLKARALVAPRFRSARPPITATMMERNDRRGGIAAAVSFPAARVRKNGRRGALVVWKSGLRIKPLPGVPRPVHCPRLPSGRPSGPCFSQTAGFTSFSPPPWRVPSRRPPRGTPRRVRRSGLGSTGCVSVVPLRARRGCPGSCSPLARTRAAAEGTPIPAGSYFWSTRSHR